MPKSSYYPNKEWYNWLHEARDNHVLHWTGETPLSHAARHIMWRAFLYAQMSRLAIT